MDPFKPRRPRLPTEHVTITLDRQFAVELTQEANRRQVPIEQLIAVALSEWLPEHRTAYQE